MALAATSRRILCPSLRSCPAPAQPSLGAAAAALPSCPATTCRHLLGRGVSHSAHPLGVLPGFLHISRTSSASGLLASAVVVPCQRRSICAVPVTPNLLSICRVTRALATSSGTPPSHYEVLGVSRTATAAEIKRAYLREAKKCHPDVDPSPGATNRFKQLAQAYQVLKDPSSRSAYDSWGQQQASSSAGAGTGARRSSSYSTSPPPPGTDNVDPFELFKAVLQELGSEVIVEKWSSVQKEAAYASQRAREGDLQPAKDFAWKHKVLFGVTVVPAVVLLRFPFVIGAAFRVLAPIVLIVLQSPALRRMIGQAAWFKWKSLLMRAAARAKQQKRP